MISSTHTRISGEIGRQDRLRQDIDRLQAQISTQKRIQAPSDDPAAAARVAELRRTQADDDAYAANADLAAAVAARADTTIAQSATALDRVTELLTKAASDSFSDADRANIAAELRGIADDLAGLAQTRDSRGQPLFPEAAAVAMPVSAGVAIAPTLTRAEVFGSGAGALAALASAAADAATTADPNARAAALATSMAAVTAGATRLTEARTEIGVRAARIDDVADRLADTKVARTGERDGLEATDMTTAIATVKAKLTTLEAAQAVFARINQRTLFDLLG